MRYVIVIVATLALSAIPMWVLYSRNCELENKCAKLQQGLVSTLSQWDQANSKAKDHILEISMQQVYREEAFKKEKIEFKQKIAQLKLELEEQQKKTEVALDRTDVATKELANANTEKEKAQALLKAMRENWGKEKAKQEGKPIQENP